MGAQGDFQIRLNEQKLATTDLFRVFGGSFSAHLSPDIIDGNRQFTITTR